MPISDISRATVTFAVAWIFCALGAEAVFRLFGDRPSEDLQGLYAPFLAGSYRLAEDRRTHANWASGSFSVQTDDIGLRCDASRAYSIKSHQRLDILFLGDSQGFGHGVDFEESLAGATAILAEGKGVRVANASVGGHAARNQLAVAQWLYDEHGISASTYVLLATPLMIFNSDSLAQSAVGPDGRLYQSPQSTAARARNWLKTHLVIYSRSRDAIRNSGFGTAPAYEADQVFRLYGAETSEAAISDRFVSLLSDIHKFTSSRGARFVVVYVPLTIETDFSSISRAAEARGFSLDPNLPARICTKGAGALGISVHDLRPILQQLKSRGDPLRLTGDFHYNRALSKACADDIWRFLQAELRL